jgi:glycine/D-amino acid oxidase-like deaminating enzyme
MTTTDVLIIGGGVMGSAAAYFLRAAQGAPSVIVVEPDPTYALAATPRASGGVRRLFSRPENIQMSQFSVSFLRNDWARLAVSGEVPELSWKQQGYLFIVPPREIPILEQNYTLQRKLGVNVELLDPNALKLRFPSLRVDDIGAAALSPEDGWLDPNAVLQGFRKKARDLGANYKTDRVAALDVKDTHVRSATLQSGDSIQARFVINTAGAWAAQICALVDMPLPVEPMRRFDHYFECAAEIETLPYIKDLDRLAMRPEGRGFTAGLVNYSEPRGFNFEIDHDYFERVVWPAAAHRIPAFDTIRPGRSWSGLYDQNSLDANMILGNWPGRLDNFFVAAGFSGHGLMHAPAVGRALSELILHGGFRSLDLSRMNYQRVIDNAPYPELGII